MNVLMVLSSPGFPPDIRVEKQATSLSEDGVHVHLLVRRGRNELSKEQVGSIVVHRVWTPFRRVKAIGDLLYFSLYRYILGFRIVAVARRARADLLHVHDLPLALPTLLAGRRIGIPVIFDMHEHYTAMVRGELDGSFVLPFARPLLGLLSAEERFVCRRADAILVVAEEHRERIANMGVAPNRVHVVLNAVDIQNIDRIIETTPGKAPMQDRRPFRVCYVGGIDECRGIDTLLAGLAILQARGVTFSATIVGDGATGVVEKLQVRAMRLGIREDVTLTGWLPFEQAVGHMLRSTICVLPYHDTPHTRSGIPHKLFQYLACGKPVLVGSVPSHRRVVCGNIAGISFRSGDPEQLADRLEWAQAHPEELAIMGRNARNIAEERFSWAEAADVLRGVYSTIGDAL